MTVTVCVGECWYKTNHNFRDSSYSAWFWKERKQDDNDQVDS